MLNSACGINDAGQVTGWATNASGQLRAFLLTPTLPGDANLDGKVDINDLTIVLAHYGQSGMNWTTGEFTGDGTVDINDLTIVLANYNQSAGASAGGIQAVPEPGSLVLLAAAVALASRARLAEAVAADLAVISAAGCIEQGDEVMLRCAAWKPCALRVWPLSRRRRRLGGNAVPVYEPGGALPSQSYGYGMGPGGAVVGGYGKGATAMNTFLYSGGTMSTLSNGSPLVAASATPPTPAGRWRGSVTGPGGVLYDPAFWSSSMRGADQPGAAPCGECARVRLCDGGQQQRAGRGILRLTPAATFTRFSGPAPAAWWTWAPVAARPATRRPSIRSRGTSWAVQQTPVCLAGLVSSAPATPER